MASKIIKSNSKTKVANSDFAPILNILKQTRLSSKKNLSQISKTLNIQLSYLRALEEGDTDNLPETVYTLGFVRSYANYLGLDGNKCVREYKDQVLFAAEPSTPPVTTPVTHQESMAPKRAVLFLTALILVGGYMSWLYISEQKELKNRAGSQLEVVQADEEEQEEESLALFDGITEPDVEDPFAFEDKPVDAKTAAKQKKMAIQIETNLRKEAQGLQASHPNVVGTEPSPIENGKIIIEAVQRSWIEIKDAERKILYRGILEEGETYPVPEGKGLIFTTGNAGGVIFSINGKKTPPMGRSGQVIRRVPLTKESISVVGKPKRPEQIATENDERPTTRAGDPRPTP